MQIGEKQTQLAVAKELLKHGVDKEIILSTTHLTIAELSKLQKK